MPSDVTVTALALIGKAATANVQMALYTDLGGHPDALVVETASAPVVVGVLELPVTPTLVVAGDYWIMGIYDTSASIGIDFANTDQVDYRSLSFGAPLPDPFGPATTYYNQAFNYYVVAY